MNRPIIMAAHPEIDDSIDAAIDPQEDGMVDDDPALDPIDEADPAPRSTAASSLASLRGDVGRSLVAGAAALSLANLLMLAIAGVGWTVLVLHLISVALAWKGWKRLGQADTDALTDHPTGTVEAQADHVPTLEPAFMTDGGDGAVPAWPVESEIGRSDANAWRMLALATAALGAIGVIGAVAVAWSIRRWARKPTTVQPGWSLAAEDDDRAQASVEAALTRRAPVVPFADVLARGTNEQKQEMISVIAANFQPSFARALQGAMNDTEPAVRMMAAAAAARIENSFLDTSMTLESRWAEAPADPHRALALAQHYDAFAATGLLDESRAVEARLRALEMFQQAAHEMPRDSLLAQAIVRLLLKLGREEDAIMLFQQRIEDGSAPAALTSWYLECLYRRRRFADLRRHAAAASLRIRDIDTLHPRSVDAMQLWATGPRRTGALVTVDVLLDADTDTQGDDAAPAPGADEPRPQRTKFELPYFRPNYPV